MKFSEVLEALSEGKLIKRKYWSNSFIVKCPDVNVDKNEITTSQLPATAKMKLFNSNGKNVRLIGQVKLVNTGKDVFNSYSTVTDYNPNWIDIFSNDWEII